MATTQRTWIGKDVPRLEDPRLLMGRATYTDDVRLAGMAARRRAAQPAGPRARSCASTRAGLARCPASSR